MTNPNDLVFSNEQHAKINPQDPTGACIWTSVGLTKREYFAAMAMQGLLSGSIIEALARGNPEMDLTQKVMLMSVASADALIAELNKGKP